MSRFFPHSALLVALLLAAVSAGAQSVDETAAETQLTSADTREGFVNGRTFAARPVTYAVIDDVAVIEGDIVLGTVAEMESFAAEVRLFEALKAMPEDNDLGFLAQRSIRRLKLSTFGNIDADPKRLWPDRTIPYVIDPSLDRPERVLEAMKQWTDTSPIRFVPRESRHKNYVYFVSKSEHCTSLVGMWRGGQQIVVGPECTTGNLIHEIGHAIGLWHEHGREDRDAHITLYPEHVVDNARGQFTQALQESDDAGAYDFGSIMHYGAYAFAKDKTKPSIVPKVAGVVIGQRLRPSAGDVDAIAQLYR